MFVYYYTWREIRQAIHHLARLALTIGQCSETKQQQQTTSRISKNVLSNNVILLTSLWILSYIKGRQTKRYFCLRSAYCIHNMKIYILVFVQSQGLFLPLYI